jgi:predicted XRE-type DNA-binding protein
MPQEKQVKDEQIIESSGNVFADLGMPNADELHYKSTLVIQISRIIKERGLSQTEAAKILGVPQPKVSDLLRGKLAGFSTDRLFKFLHLLGQDIEITVKPTPKRKRPKAGWVQVQLKGGAASKKRAHG